MTDDSGLSTAPMTDEERAAADAWLASGGAQPYALTPAPPGPNPGQPGHFAHHTWLETSVKSLSLPAPQSIYQGTQATISSTAWTAINCDATIVNPDATRTLTVFCQWQTQGAFAATIIVTVTTDGATVLGVGTRGEEARIGTQAQNMLAQATRLVSLNPGTSRIRMGGQLAAAGASVLLNYNKLIVIPVGWV